VNNENVANDDDASVGDDERGDCDEGADAEHTVVTVGSTYINSA
jgi:hypothetical protein